MMRYFFFFFWFTVSFAQPITINIDAVTATDSTSQRKFKVDFTIKNVSEGTVSFLLDPTKFTPISAGSMQNAVFYKIYEEEESMDAPNILDGKLAKYETIPDFNKVSPDSIQKVIDRYVAQLNENRQLNLYTSIIKLKPGESRKFSNELYWNLERYRSYADNEFFIDGKKLHYLELTLIILLDEYESKLSAEQFATIKSDTTMIKGWFASNKTKIDFSE